MKNLFAISILMLIVLCGIDNLCLAQERVIPENSDNNFNVLIDNHPLKGSFEIVDIEVVIKPKKSSAEIEFVSHDEKLGLQLIGRKLTIQLGYHSEMENVFDGKIVKHKIEQSPGEHLIMSVECEGISAKSKISDSPVMTILRGSNVIEFEMEYGQDSKLEGELLIEGFNKALPGSSVTLNGFGNPFDGNVLIYKIKHLLKDGDWGTKLFIQSPE